MKSSNWFILMTTLLVFSMAFNFTLLYFYNLNRPITIIPEKIEVGQYNITFVDACYAYDYDTGEFDKCLAKTQEDGNITIQQHREIGYIERSCVHEILHNVLVIQNDNQEENFILENEQYFQFPECTKLAQAIAKGED